MLYLTILALCTFSVTALKLVTNHHQDRGDPELSKTYVDALWPKNAYTKVSPDSGVGANCSRSSPDSKLKVAIILFGMSRGFKEEKFGVLFQNHVIQPMVNAGVKPDAFAHLKLGKNSKEDVVKAMGRIGVTDFHLEDGNGMYGDRDTSKYVASPSCFYGKYLKATSLQPVLGRQFSIQQGHFMMKKHESETNSKYDVVVMTRPDVGYVHDFPISELNCEQGHFHRDYTVILPREHSDLTGSLLKDLCVVDDSKFFQRDFFVLEQSGTCISNMGFCKLCVTHDFHQCMNIFKLIVGILLFLCGRWLLMETFTFLPSMLALAGPPTNCKMCYSFMILSVVSVCGLLSFWRSLCGLGGGAQVVKMFATGCFLLGIRILFLLVTPFKEHTKCLGSVSRACVSGLAASSPEALGLKWYFADVFPGTLAKNCWRIDVVPRFYGLFYGKLSNLLGAVNTIRTLYQFIDASLWA